MDNKLVANVIKPRKMGHGNVGPLTAKGLSLSSQLSRQAPLPYLQTPIVWILIK